MSNETVSINIIRSIKAVDPAQWNHLTQPFPFLTYQFLRALEESGCTSADTGWMPQCIVAYDNDGALIGCAPHYIKAHSMGEFVYDWAWADAAYRSGISYYPKGIVAAPFTPATSSRLLVDDRLNDSAKKEVRSALASALIELAQSFDLSGVHVLFCEDDDVAILKNKNFFIRQHHQYHWQNHDYESFADYLEPFTSKRRREIRRQRRRLDENGVEVRVFSGDDLSAEHRDFAWTCYKNTIDKFPWGRQYLNHKFYVQLFDEMADDIRLFIAFNNQNDMVGSALTFLGGNTLYGRYWGCVEDISYLHFETCLYAPIEYAIEQGIQKIEPGQGGEHKFARGFEATVTQSMHWISHPSLAEALEDHANREGNVIISEVEKMNTNASFQPPNDDSQ